MVLRRGGDLRRPLSFRDYFFLAGLSKKSLSVKDFFDAATGVLIFINPSNFYGRGRQNRTAATPTPRVRTTTIRFPGLSPTDPLCTGFYREGNISRSLARRGLFCFVQGSEAFGARDNFSAVGQSGRLQVRLLLPLGGGVELGGAQTHPFPRHHSFFFAKLANSGHRLF